ncbi:BamA/TamA family outer membrane protein [Paraferrimonas haliotis]|nr:BamA/TamA family outer membrane protein [Paraferrimonas haliotis]
MSVAFFSASTTASIMEQLKDPLDGRFDASEWILENAVGFMPVPIIITEPAVGVGGGAALLFFHETEAQRQWRKDNPNQVNPELPAVTGVVAAATENGSKLGGLFHSNSWKDDSLRYLGALFGADLNLKFYPIENGPAFGFNIKGEYLLQELEYRLGQSNVFLGAGYSLMQSEVDFGLVTNLPDLGLPALNSKDGALNIKITYDSLDNRFSASSGIKAGISAKFHHENLGGDYQYQDYHAYVNAYQPINSKWTIALRGDGKYITDGSPFYARPFVDLRGISAMRYQGDRVVLAEAELRHHLDSRWTVLGFVGSGQADNFNNSVADSSWQTAFGGGFRYLVARQLGLTSGIDIARGPNETAFYIQTGGAW